MGQFTITTTIAVDAATVRTNTVTFEAQAHTDYERTVSATYVDLINGEDQPTSNARVMLRNTGAEPALVRVVATGGSGYYFTGLAPGCSMECPLRFDGGSFTSIAARGESADTTIRVIAQHF